MAWLKNLTLVLLLVGAFAHAETAPLHNLLNDVQQLRELDGKTNAQRVRTFTENHQNQQTLLEQSRLRLEAAEAKQQALKQAFDDKDVQIAQLEALLSQRSGQLGEVFGVAKESANELLGLLPDSMASADYPQRTSALAFADSKRVPSVDDLQSLWYQLQLEMTALGEVKPFQAPVVDQQGESKIATVVRVGPFAAFDEHGQYLTWDSELQQLVEIRQQPATSYRTNAAMFAQGQSADVLIDPSLGQMFALLAQKPTIVDRIKQGGEVGYVIIALGVLGLLVAFWQVMRLSVIGIQVKKQLARPERFSTKNPLGRVLMAVSAVHLDFEQRELKMEESVLKEVPSVEQGQSFIKLLAAVAPLLGLLGTVVGMIATFQSITFFGTGDPKLLAGGISQALMTTVLGLVVAIPLLFAHSYLSAKSRRTLQILQEKSLAVLVAHEEQEGRDLPHAA